MKTSLLLILLHFPLISFASGDPVEEPCAEVDLNSSADSPLRKIPVEDQDGAGICYAYAASTLANHWQLKRGGDVKKGFHPLYVAGTYSRVEDRKDTSGGDVSTALNRLRDTGNCPSNRVDEMVRNWSIHGLPYADVLSLIESSSGSSVPQVSAHASSWISGYLGRLEPGSNETTSCELNQKVSRFLKSLPNLNSNQILQNVFSKCEPFEAVSQMPEPSRVRKGTDSEFHGILAKTMKNGDPAAVSLCSNLFYDPTYIGLKPGPTREALNSDECGRHAVVMTGMKTLKGECKYLIRNSWGSDWRAKGQDCACLRADGRYEEICSDFSEAKEVVGCWFSKKSMLGNLYKITTL